MIDDVDARSILDTFGDRAFGPAWIVLGMAEAASAVATAIQGRYPTGLEGFAHHALDLIFPAMTAFVGFVSMRDRRRGRERHLEIEREKMLLKHELEKLRIGSATPQKEADSGDDTFELGPIS